MGGCIVYTGIRLLLLFVPLFFIFLYNFQTLKFFVTLFSGTVRPRRLKLGTCTHVYNGWMYHLYQNQAAAAYSSLLFFPFFSNFQTLTIFFILSSGTARPRRLKLGTHMNNGWMYHVYRNQAASAYLSLYFFIFLSNFQTLIFFCHFSQELWGLEGWNLIPTWTMSGCIMYTGIRLLLCVCPFIFSFFSL